jgi:assimilatory nitrate reductase catalytic subunit
MRRRSRRFLEALEQGHDLWSTASTCDLDPARLREFYELFAANPRTVTVFSQGINQSIRGTDQGNAIINLHLATGRIGQPGATLLDHRPAQCHGRARSGRPCLDPAAHMDFAPENVARVGRFWAAPRVAAKPGLKAVDLFRAMNEGRIKAVWIMATNPAVSLPDAGTVRAALEKCPFVVVSDVIAQTDTGAYADVRLPAAAWGEKDGTVTTRSARSAASARSCPCPAKPGPTGGS